VAGWLNRCFSSLGPVLIRWLYLAGLHAQEQRDHAEGEHCGQAFTPGHCCLIRRHDRHPFGTSSRRVRRRPRVHHGRAGLGAKPYLAAADQMHHGGDGFLVVDLHRTDSPDGALRAGDADDLRRRPANGRLFESRGVGSLRPVCRPPHRRPSSILIKRAQHARFSGRMCCSQAGCGGSQVRASPYSHQACAEIAVVPRYRAQCSRAPTARNRSGMCTRASKSWG
jgi:hypothetical protein